MTDPADRLYERVLVLRGQAGDAAAFTELVERYHARLQYFLRKLLGEEQRAEDVLQDTWLAVLRGLPRLVEPGAFRHWLYRVARDGAFRELRRRRLVTRPLEEADLAHVPAEDPVLTAEDAGRVHVALDRLSPEHREVLVLRFVEDMTYEEIARVIDRPVGTVRSRLHHAKQALRAILEQGEQP